MKSFLDFSEAVIQRNGTDKIIIEDYCDACDRTTENCICDEGITIGEDTISEESGEHHDYEHVKSTMKKVDYDTYTKHMNKHDADHSMENKHKVDTQHSGSYTGKIHGAEVSHKVSKSGEKEYYIKEETLDEISKDTIKSYIGKAVKDVAEKKRQQEIVLNRSKQPKLKDSTKQSNINYAKSIGDSAKKRASNIGKAAMKYAESTEVQESRGHKILATAMANAERMKTVQIPTPAERRAELEKQNKEKQMKEAAEKKPYIVISHVSDNTGTRAGGEKVEKNRVATKLIATSPEHALQLSKAHHEKSGRKVHSASIKEEVDMGQADRTLRSKEKSKNTYHVKDSSGKIISTHDNHSDAMRVSLKHDDHKVVKEAVDTVKKDASGKVIAWSHEGDWEKNSTKKQGQGKVANLAGQALKKTKELAKEEVDLEEKVGDDHVNKTEKLRQAGAKEMSLKDKILSIPRGFKAAVTGKSEDDRKLKEGNMLTYSEFMASIEESRIDDIKDKLAADREARLNKYDFSKEKAAKKNPVTKVKGHSYGAGEEEGEVEKHEPAEPAEKRGRGRPAGSKSGARA